MPLVCFLISNSAQTFVKYHRKKSPARVPKIKASRMSKQVKMQSKDFVSLLPEFCIKFNRTKICSVFFFKPTSHIIMEFITCTDAQMHAHNKSLRKYCMCCMCSKFSNTICLKGVRLLYLVTRTMTTITASLLKENRTQQWAGN